MRPEFKGQSDFWNRAQREFTRWFGSLAGGPAGSEWPTMQSGVQAELENALQALLVPCTDRLGAELILARLAPGVQGLRDLQAAEGPFIRVVRPAFPPHASFQPLR